MTSTSRLQIRRTKRHRPVRVRIRSFRKVHRWIPWLQQLAKKNNWIPLLESLDLLHLNSLLHLDLPHLRCWRVVRYRWNRSIVTRRDSNRIRHYMLWRNISLLPSWAVMTRSRLIPCCWATSWPRLKICGIRLQVSRASIVVPRYVYKLLNSADRVAHESAVQ